MKMRTPYAPAFHKGRTRRLSLPCLMLSAAVLAGSLAEAAIRYDAVSAPLRIIFRLAGTGKLTPGEIFEAVRPEAAALAAPLWVLLCALAGLAGIFTVLGRRRGVFALLLSFAAAGLSLLVPRGLLLGWLRAAGGILNFALGVLFTLRAALPPPSGRCPSGGGGSLFAPPSRDVRRGGGAQSALPTGRSDGKGRLFAPAERKRLFGAGEERRPLFRRKDGRGPS